ncbi:dynein intermediate chain 2, axonemal [Caerostris darwini]|uniref:Dynein intermediate chain 2, axonemal n=1 Tax=Caerostris darwini TaxID=1538125 RepID=A0AAV4RWY5_9ARAC|nr:dynein intermediate chain 2, axonemal [Caerostris darwini]
MMDRESKREKLLEGMTREQKVREKNSENEENMKNIPMEEDNFYCLEEDDNINTAGEFDSQFDSDENYFDEELDESVTEMPFLDLQFIDALKTALTSKP